MTVVELGMRLLLNTRSCRPNVRHPLVRDVIRSINQLTYLISKEICHELMITKVGRYRAVLRQFMAALSNPRADRFHAARQCWLNLLDI